MNENAKTILTILSEYLEKNPCIRFTQALANLGINEFADKIHPENKDFNLRDPYQDTDDKVLQRLIEQIKKTKETK